MKGSLKRSPLERELQRLNTQERRYWNKRRGEKENRLNRLLEDKVPDKLQETLDAAFAGAFSLVFRKGTGLIEKTYDKDRLQSDSNDDCRRILQRQDRSSLRDVTHKVGGSGRKNMLLSGAAGIGMGVMGAGMPDIPLFTAMILKSIYQIALQYGFSYESQEERYFILLLIQGAMGDWDTFQKVEKELEVFMDTQLLPKYYSQEGQIRSTAAVLSQQLLYLKFLQGLPIVGAVGGAYDVVHLKRITEYAELKYRRRFYQKMEQNGTKAAR